MSENSERDTLEKTPDEPEGIAIIGMSGRFPGAVDVSEYWENIKNGVESITHFSDEQLETRPDPGLTGTGSGFVRSKGILEGVDLFDAKFWGYMPRESATMDPQHRVFLDCVWEALEHGGYDTERYEGSIGVYAGCFMNTYLLHNLCSDPAFLVSLVESIQVGTLQTEFGNDKDHIATRASYKLNLRGPSVNIQCACSTSLVAIAHACQSLLGFQCDMALAGGVTITFPQKKGYFYTEEGMVSADGHCRAFDEHAAGTVFSNGAAVLLLKRELEAIEDGNTIYAVIKGSAVNNDGSEKVSYTAPSVQGQVEVIRLAQALANVDAGTISYVEAHGTATPLGDPIEISALTQAFRDTTDENQFCAVGSVKTNIGHLDVASGAAAVIKAAMSLHEKVLTPSLHFTRPNPKIQFQSTPFYVNTELKEWKKRSWPRRVGVSSFGVGGTNAHLVLQESPELPPHAPARSTHLLLLSAKTETALKQQTLNLASHLKKHPEVSLEDVAYTLQVGRRVFEKRRIVLSCSVEEAIKGLENTNPNPLDVSNRNTDNTDVVFMFPGQGAQFPNMAGGLYESELAFKDVFDRCSKILTPIIGRDIREVLFPSSGVDQVAAEELMQTTLAQPAIFVVEYALANLWMSWGVRPKALVGHSVGEFTAACLAGIFSLEDALLLVTTRGRLMQQMPSGAMLSVRLPVADVAPLVGPELSIAAVNSPSLVVVSGTHDAVGRLQKRLEDDSVPFTRLHTSHAFHSAMMDPAVKPTVEAVSKVPASESSIPIMSTVTGKWLKEEEAKYPEYWGKNLRQTVRFSEAVQNLLSMESPLLLEVGPGQTLSLLSKQIAGPTRNPISFSSLGHPLSNASDMETLLTTMGRLWLAGIPIDWDSFNGPGRRRIALPTYPFEGKSHWVEPAYTEKRAVVDGFVAPADLKDEYGLKACSDAGSSVMERLIRNQIKIMEEQLALLRR